MKGSRADVRRFGSALIWAALLAGGCSPSASSTGGSRAGGTSGAAGGNGSMTPGSGGSTGAGGTTTSPDGGVAPGTGGSPVMPGQLPPGGSGTLSPAACVDGKAITLPRTFFTNCSGCHSAFGPSPLPDDPNLFSYQGSASEFAELVRKGGKTMPPFAASTISDADLESALAYFKAGKPSDGTCGDTGGPLLLPADSCGGSSTELAPLFGAADNSKAVVTTTADGTIVTRGAGRVRGRHELEEEFSPFHPLYFENRSFEFRIEDTVAAGGDTIKVTYLPVAAQANQPITNFRAWKIYGNGNVFHVNEFMDVKTNKHYEFTVKSNTREKRELRKGDLFEFEFGIFQDGNAAPGRTNYYTDTYRYQVGVGGLTAINIDPAMGPEFMGPDVSGLSGGGMTFPYIKAEPKFYFSQMGVSIQPENIQPFLEGRRLFHTDFATGMHSEPGNPVFTANANKAGPIVNQNSCEGCHDHNGRGKPPELGAAMSTMVIKTFGAGPPDAMGASPAHPVYGKQLQNLGTGAEGEATITFQEVTRQFKDGTPYTLLSPTIGFRKMAAGEPEIYSVRVARQLVGMGLLEAVSEQSIFSRADAGDCNKDGISGRPNVGLDPETGKLKVGRFGWKASKVSVKHQVAEAMLVDMNVTSTLFPKPECPGGQTSCAGGTAPELSDADLERVTAYMRGLGVLPRRNVADPKVKQGEVLFTQVGCVSCHAPTLLTGSNHPSVELRNQLIRPYTDLLLHDMGPELADKSNKEFNAEASEWRTPPVWGIGAVETVSGHTRFLHDGRARTLLEAVLWHGGEAQAARDRVLALTAAEREALVAFLKSL
ncbi:MAG TPA: di-heme oxidoredictase family protein [Polyangia bacterium]